MSNGGNTVPTITRAEHIGPADTGDNIEAKRVATYGWNGSGWQRSPLALLSKPYDRMVITYTSNTKDTISSIVTKLNGVTQETITNTSSATVDDLERS